MNQNLSTKYLIKPTNLQTMKNKKLEIAVKMLTALLIFLVFLFTQERQQYLISFIALGIAVITSIATFKRTFPLFMGAMISYFVCSYMKLFQVNELFYLNYAFYFGFGSVLLIASLIWYLAEEIQLIFKTDENAN